MCVIRITPFEIFLPILISIQPKQMTTPRDSNIKVDNTNNNQEDNLRELIATQNQLNQMTAQFIANTSGEDSTLQGFLETQAQMLHKVTDQMLNMESNFSKGVYDNKDDKDVILEGTKACNICGDKDHTSKEHGDQCPKKRERFTTFEVRYEEHE